MTTEQIRLVQGSFAKVEPIADVAGIIFYERLFELDPFLKPLFRIGIEDQGRKLMQVLAVAVKGLDRVEEMVPMLEEMGRRHVAYGVTAANYRTVGKALIWTLENGLGEDVFTREMREAWLVTYDTLAGVMQRGAESSVSAEATMKFHASSH